MTTAIQQPGETTSLLVSIASTFTPIAQVYELDGPEITVEAIDNTTLASALITTRPSRQPEPTKISGKAWFDPNDTVTQALMVTDIDTPKVVEAFKIIFADQNTTHAFGLFSGFFTSFKLNGMKAKSNLGVDFEIQLTTLITYTVGVP